jgi:hypothetical protein
VKRVVALESAKQDGYPQAQAFESTEQSRSNPRSNPQTGGKKQNAFLIGQNFSNRSVS